VDYLSLTASVEELKLFSIMFRSSILVLLILGVAFETSEALAKKPCLYGVCSYTGDPHLVPYPSAYGQPQKGFICKNVGWEVLTSNIHVSIYVLVGPGLAYNIIDVSYLNPRERIHVLALFALVRFDLSWSITLHRDWQQSKSTVVCCWHSCLIVDAHTWFIVESSSQYRMYHRAHLRLGLSCHSLRVLNRS
jgi:hypothetical protein